MAKQTLKTTPNEQSVEAFLNTITPEQKRQDAYQLVAIMQKITQSKPIMWGSSIVGFGSYHYKYESGREGDWFLTGFSPRKQSLTLYIMSGFEAYEDLLTKLGKHKTGKSCLYIKKLSDIDLFCLENLITQSIKHLKNKYEQK